MKRKRNENISRKIEKEKRIVKLMINIYCEHHHNLDILCKDCNEVIEYVEKKLDLCPFMESKSYCSNCSVNCYNLYMREKIKNIMGYSGPRMFFYNPIITIDHIYQGIKHKYILKNI